MQSEYTWYVNDSIWQSSAGPQFTWTPTEVDAYSICAQLNHECINVVNQPPKKCRIVTIGEAVTGEGRDVYVCKNDFASSYGVWWGCNQSGGYEIEYAHASPPHCDSTVHFSVVCLSPEVVIMPPDPLSPGDSVVVLDGSGSYPGPPGAVITWEWSAYSGGELDGPTDQPIAYATSTGQYCLVITASSPNGAVECSDFGCVTVSSFDGDANPRFGMEEEMWVFPSPASDRVWVQFSESMSSSGLLLVHNSAGQEVHCMVKPALQSQLEITVAHWTPGLYTVSLLRDDAEKLISQRLVILR